MLMSVLAIVAVSATPLHGQKPLRPTPTLVGTPGAATQPSTAQPAAGQPSTTRQGTAAKPVRASPTLGTPPATAQPAVTPTGPTPLVQPQAAPSAAPAAAGTFTAGLAMDPFSEEGGGELPAYSRRFALQLDSAIALMVDVFRNTSGQPLSGATAPTALSQRERDRWNRCRDLHWDLQSYATAAHELPENFEETPALLRAAAALDSSLTALQATSECDNVASMITAPDRWTPWGQQYQASARRFYTGWYPQVREVQEHNRAFILALNGTLPAGERIAVPPAMPRNPPYAGAAVR